MAVKIDTSKIDELLINNPDLKNLILKEIENAVVEKKCNNYMLFIGGFVFGCISGLYAIQSGLVVIG